MMNGVLVVDKPQGLTSHDVVATARRALGETRIGHTGTLDPLATGVLPLAVGRATRLVRFLTASDKDYDATIRFGLTTDSYDVTGAETSRTNVAPAREDLLAAIDSLRGEYPQLPPPYSAKKIDGRRAYELARQRKPVELTPAPVRVDRADLVELHGDRARVALTCSAGFYVRSFAHALGERVGTGACLEALRRTRSGEFRLHAAISLDDLYDRAAVAAALIGLERLLRDFPAVRVTARGRVHVSHGRELSPAEYEPSEPAGIVNAAGSPADGVSMSQPDGGALAGWVRMLDGEGALIAVGTAGPGSDSLHPAVVLI